MQIKNLNAYKITHKNGNIETINADSPVSALENMVTEESVSPVIQLTMTKEGVRTLESEMTTEVAFITEVSEEDTGSIATPSAGTIHIGDTITLQAIPARNYQFVNWKRNGVVISTEAEFSYTMTELAEGETSATFTATFALADVAWTSEVSPSEATSAGCVAFPGSGTIEANGTLSLIAVEATGYTFNHWERNGVSIGTNKILEASVTPLAEGETACVYTAVFEEA